MTQSRTGHSSAKGLRGIALRPFGLVYRKGDQRGQQPLLACKLVLYGREERFGDIQISGSVTAILWFGRWAKRGMEDLWSPGSVLAHPVSCAISV